MTQISWLTLIQQTRTTDDIGQPSLSESTKSLICEVYSVSREEYAQGRQAGLDPAYVFVISRFGYSGERVVEFRGERLVVTRTYERDENTVELHVERSVGTFVPEANS